MRMNNNKKWVLKNARPTTQNPQINKLEIKETQNTERSMKKGEGDANRTDWRGEGWLRNKTQPVQNIENKDSNTRGGK